MANQDENFDTLRRALKLKRYEQPPPGYFNNFSRDIVARIRAHEFPDRLGNLERMEWESPWLTRILGIFQARPAYAGMVGAVACLLMICGIVYSERGGVAQAGTQGSGGTLAAQPASAGIGLDAMAATPTSWSTNPVSLFDQFRLDGSPMNARGSTVLSKP